MKRGAKKYQKTNKNSIKTNRKPKENQQNHNETTQYQKEKAKSLLILVGFVTV